jgi:hypothetical protein
VIYDAATGAVSAKTYLSAAKGVVKVTEKVAKGFSKNSFDWLGLSSSSLEKTGTSLGEELGKAIDKYNFGKATTTADKVAVVAKWVGSVLTVATTAYDNFTDTTENNSTARKLAETVGESAVKIGGGILIGAAVSAVLGTVGAPALVVGGVTVAATWAINKGFEAVTGKDAAEFISDTVLDQLESVAKKAGEVISGWWSSITSPQLVGGGGGSW